MEANKMHGEKARWELHKNTAVCLEQIVEATPNKRAVVPPLDSQITNDLNNCWKSKDEFISDMLLWTPTHGCARVGQPAKTSALYG